MPRQGTRELSTIVSVTSGFAGGVNSRDAINSLAPDEVAAAENGVLDERGAFVKRLGLQSLGTFGSSGDRAISMYTFYRGLSSPQVIIHTTAGKLYYTNDPTASPQVWVEIASGLSASQPMSYETFNSKCYMSNGVDNYCSWDGATYATYPAAPKGKFIRLWKDTMWVSGVAALPDRVYSSDAGNAEAFGVAAWVDVAKGDGDIVSALGSDGVYLIVFKRNRHMIIFDPAIFSNRVVDYDKGCESHFTVVQFEGTIYFLSRRGICKYLGDSPSEIISGKIDPTFDAQVVNLNALSSSFAYTVGNQVGWSIPELGSIAPTLQIEYYPRLAGITPYGNRGTGPFVFHRMAVGPFARYRSGLIDYLFGGGTNVNKVLRVFGPVGTDDGTIFSSVLETGVRDLNDPIHTKYIRTLRFLGRGEVTVEIKRNFKADTYKSFNLDMSSSPDIWSLSEDWNVGSWGPDSLFKEDLINPDAYGRYFQLRFSDTKSTTGRRGLKVGAREYFLEAGQWTLFLVTLDGTILGVRD